MRTSIFIICLMVSNPGIAEVELCRRPAKILFGMVNHYWIQTDNVIAGMGSARNTDDEMLIGDKFEAPWITKVYVIDHSDDVPVECAVQPGVNEGCVEEELEIGEYLGRFRLFNNCATFVRKILRRCKTDEQKQIERRLKNRHRNRYRQRFPRH